MLPLWRASQRRAAEFAASQMALQAQQSALLERAASAETTQDMLEQQASRAEQARILAEAKTAEALLSVSDAERRAALAEQRSNEMQLRMGDWEKTKQEFIQAANAAALKTGAELSTKLLEDHKRESEASKKAQEEAAEGKAKIFTERLEQLKSTIAVLHSQTTDTAKRTLGMWQALSSPGSAGRLSEIGLANLLKNLGLTEGQDFEMQFHVEGEGEGSIRPDALIYLPQDAVMIIDSKASKHLLEFGEHESGSAEEASARQKLRTSMQAHLKSLGGKEYRTRVEQHFRKRSATQSLGRTVLVMYLPAESMLQHLLEVEPNFMQLAKAGHDILVTGPNGLHSLLGLMSGNIMIQRQMEGQAQILTQVKAMVDGAAKAFVHVEKISKGMKAAADGLESFTGSLNRYFLPKAHALQKLGVEVPKALPQRLKSIEVRLTEDALTIEGEVNESDESLPMLRVVQG